MVATQEIDPVIRALQNEIKTKQLKIDALELEAQQKNLEICQKVEDIKNHPDYVALLAENEHLRKQVNFLQMCMHKDSVPASQSEIDARDSRLEQMRKENEHLRIEIAMLHKAWKVERELDGETGESAREKRRLCREDALVHQRRCLEDSHKNLQNRMARQIMKRSMEYAFKHAICLVKPEGGIESESEDWMDEEDLIGGTGTESLTQGQWLEQIDTVDGETQPKVRHHAAQELLEAVKEEVKLPEPEPKEEFKQQQQVPEAKVDVESIVKQILEEMTQEPKTKPLIQEPLLASTSAHEAKGKQAPPPPTPPRNAKEEIRAKVAAAAAATSPPVEKKQVEVEVVSNISVGSLRKKWFDDEEEVILDEEIELLMTKTYTQKVSFDDDEETVEVEDGKLVEENEVKGQGVDQVDVPHKLVPVPEEEFEDSEEGEPEFLSSDDDEESTAAAKEEPVVTILVGALRKKNFVGEDVIEDLDSDIEEMITKTYSTRVSFDDEE